LPAAAQAVVVTAAAALTRNLRRPAIPCPWFVALLVEGIWIWLIGVYLVVSCLVRVPDRGPLTHGSFQPDMITDARGQGQARGSTNHAD